VFDTNHNGQLDAGDAGFANFRILASNANGTQTLETLAQAGVASINLNANAVTQAMPDGSTINGAAAYVDLPRYSYRGSHTQLLRRSERTTLRGSPARHSAAHGRPITNGQSTTFRLAQAA